MYEQRHALKCHAWMSSAWLESQAKANKTDKVPQLLKERKETDFFFRRAAKIGHNTSSENFVNRRNKRPRSVWCQKNYQGKHFQSLHSTIFPLLLLSCSHAVMPTVLHMQIQGSSGGFSWERITTSISPLFAPFFFLFDCVFWWTLGSPIICMQRA